jgi:hypothetical protein
MSDWRSWAITAGVLLLVAGLALWVGTGTIGLLIVGAVVLLTALLERSYGSLVRRPTEGDWRPTDERFVDPESGKLVTVWFNPSTGERRYVTEDDAAHSSSR